MAAPINVKLQSPTVSIPGWGTEAAQWMALNEQIRGNPCFHALTVKAAYVIGVIHDICASVTILLTANPRLGRAVSEVWT